MGSIATNDTAIRTPCACNQIHSITQKHPLGLCGLTLCSPVLHGYKSRIPGGVIIETSAIRTCL